MKKIYSLILGLVLILQITACGVSGDTNVTKDTTSTSSSTYVSKPSDNASTSSSDTVIRLDNKQKNYSLVEPTPAKYNKSADIFNLTEKEIIAYNKFPIDFDKKAFIGLEPKSLIKIYITYGIDNAWKPEYEMFKKDSLPPEYTLQVAYNEYRKNLEDEENVKKASKENKDIKFISKADMAKMFLKDADKATTEINGDNAQVTIVSPKTAERESETLTTKFVKNKDGYWEMLFRPFE